MDQPDHYGILGVAPDAPVDVIRAAFRRRIRESHPDTASQSGVDATALIAAYRCLRDPVSRARYDRRSEAASLPLTLAARHHGTGTERNRGPWRGFGQVVAGGLIVVSAAAALYLIAGQKNEAGGSSAIAVLAGEGTTARIDRIRIEAGLDVHWIVTMHGREVLKPYSSQCYGLGQPRISKAQCDYCAAFDDAAFRDTRDAYFDRPARQARAARFCVAVPRELAASG